MTRYQYEVERLGIPDVKIADVVKCSPAAAGRYRTGESTMPVDRAILASKFLDIPVEQLFQEYVPEVKEAA